MCRCSWHYHVVTVRVHLHTHTLFNSSTHCCRFTEVEVGVRVAALHSLARFMALSPLLARQHATAVIQSAMTADSTDEMQHKTPPAVCVAAIGTLFRPF